MGRDLQDLRLVSLGGGDDNDLSVNGDYVHKLPQGKGEAQVDNFDAMVRRGKVGICGAQRQAVGVAGEVDLDELVNLANVVHSVIPDEKGNDDVVRLSRSDTGVNLTMDLRPEPGPLKHNGVGRYLFRRKKWVRGEGKAGRGGRRDLGVVCKSAGDGKGPQPVSLVV